MSQKISVVTPSFNQGRFLEKTILSVLEQDYPDFEYIIIDGGSTDNSKDIIKKYESRLAYWESERDRGQSHAINKGFSRATGDIFVWLNSDDYFHPGAFRTVAELFSAHPEVGAVVGAGDMLYEETGKRVRVEPFPVTLDSLFASVTGPFFMQPSCFFSRRTWEESGPLDENLHLAMDTDLWLKIAKRFTFITTAANLSTTVVHPDAKTRARAAESYSDGFLVVARHGGYAEARSQMASLLNKLFLDTESLNETNGKLYLETVRMDKEISGLHVQLNKYYNELTGCRAELANTGQLLQDKDQELVSEQTKNRQLQGYIADMHLSLSWRLTTPLRAVHSFFNKVLGTTK